MAMWDHLERRHGLRGARASLHPHVSYLVGDSSRPNAVGTALARAAAAIRPVTVTIEGLGIFDGPRPVLFLRVAKSPELLEIHLRLLDATQDLWDDLWPHYLPEAWCPHVTLALDDLAPGQAAAVLADLGRRSVRFTTRLESLDQVRLALPRHVYLGRWPLCGAAPPLWAGGGILTAADSGSLRR
jgi:2'-5' RNA ligase